MRDNLATDPTSASAGGIFAPEKLTVTDSAIVHNSAVATNTTFDDVTAEGGGIPMRISAREMKALFYVKDYLGNRDFNSRKAFESSRRDGRHAIVTFEDGETIWGVVPSYDPKALGFDFYPSDPDDNNLRIFVVNRSVRSIEFRS